MSVQSNLQFMNLIDPCEQGNGLTRKKTCVAGRLTSTKFDAHVSLAQGGHEASSPIIVFFSGASLCRSPGRDRPSMLQWVSQGFSGLKIALQN